MAEILEVKKVIIKSTYRKMLADLHTPVSMYLKLRDQFANSILLESSDYHGQDNSYSFICFEPQASFRLDTGQLTVKIGQEAKSIANPGNIVQQLSEFIETFDYQDPGAPVISNGLFGFMSYEAVSEFESISLQSYPESHATPLIFYSEYRYVIVFDHFKNEIYLFEHTHQGENRPSGLDHIISILQSKNIPEYRFKAMGDEKAEITDADFISMVKKGKEHCRKGDVYQVVLSRKFERHFWGDEFNVYRSLRSLNPSPYLFFFDHGNYKLFGSSPEAQLVIKNGKASIYPIAGTFRRTGHEKGDQELAKQLQKDAKENAEHIMLVDLARNDLSKSTDNVEVETFKEIQFYSHVIHLVSKVSGDARDNGLMQLAADTFPAGTLSGAPKYRAMQLIDQYERSPRGFYGGAIGFIGFNGDYNHAIMIRSFLSYNNKLVYQGGAGIVSQSVPESELAEVNNKLGALRKAIKEAATI